MAKAKKLFGLSLATKQVPQVHAVSIDKKGKVSVKKQKANMASLQGTSTPTSTTTQETTGTSALVMTVVRRKKPPVSTVPKPRPTSDTDGGPDSDWDAILDNSAGPNSPFDIGVTSVKRTVTVKLPLKGGKKGKIKV